MASVRENNYIGSFVTDEQYLNNFVGNGGSVTPPTDNLLLEDGFNYLQEDGTSFFLLE